MRAWLSRKAHALARFHKWCVQAATREEQHFTPLDEDLSPETVLTKKGDKFCPD